MENIRDSKAIEYCLHCYIQPQLWVTSKGGAQVRCECGETGPIKPTVEEATSSWNELQKEGWRKGVQR